MASNDQDNNNNIVQPPPPSSELTTRAGVRRMLDAILADKGQDGWRLEYYLQFRRQLASTAFSLVPVGNHGDAAYVSMAMHLLRNTILVQLPEPGGVSLCFHCDAYYRSSAKRLIRTRRQARVAANEDDFERQSIESMAYVMHASTVLQRNPWVFLASLAVIGIFVVDSDQTLVSDGMEFFYREMRINHARDLLRLVLESGRRRRRNERLMGVILALLMGLHPRLGADCAFRDVSEDVMGILVIGAVIDSVAASVL